jgi:cell division inhibitor SulA
MNALLKDSSAQSLHHWSLWVAPSSQQISSIKDLDADTKAKILLLHPKHPELLMRSLLQALESGFYQSVKMAKTLLTQRDQNILQLRALRFGVDIEWTDNSPSLNKASQLSLI